MRCDSWGECVNGSDKLGKKPHPIQPIIARIVDMPPSPCLAFHFIAFRHFKSIRSECCGSDGISYEERVWRLWRPFASSLPTRAPVCVVVMCVCSRGGWWSVWREE